MIEDTHNTSAPAECEQRLAELWASVDMYSEGEFVKKKEQLVAELPPEHPLALLTHAGSLDSTGHSDLAVDLYRKALEQGFDGARRRQAVIQLASSLRDIWQDEESVRLLMAEMEAGSDDLDDAVSAFLALALVDTGREREAASLALEALSRHRPRSQQSLARYVWRLNPRSSS